jgi:transposase
VVSEVVDGMDTSAIEEKYSRLGQHTYHPKIIIKLLIYGYATGMRSGRRIAAACESDTAFMFLAQMYRPDFRTINDFRKNHAAAFDDIFGAVLAACRRLGLGRAGTIAIDGTKLRAAASAKRSKDREGFERWEERLRREVAEIIAEADRTDAAEDELYGEARGDELPPELRSREALRARVREVLESMGEGEKRNLTDPEARFMRTPEGKIRPAYNCQIAVDQDRLVLAAEATDEAGDFGQLTPLLEQALQDTGIAREGKGRKAEGRDAAEPLRVLADAGYASYDNYEYLKEHGLQGYIPDKDFARSEREGVADPYHMDNFTYDAERDLYICPEGKPLPYMKSRVVKGPPRRRQHIYEGTECPICPVKGACTRAAGARRIHREMREDLKKEMRARLATEEGRAIYRQRMHLVEGPFGHLKHNLGYRYFLLRGKLKVGAELKLMCIGYNLKKLQAHKLALAEP